MSYRHIGKQETENEVGNLYIHGIDIVGTACLIWQAVFALLYMATDGPMTGREEKKMIINYKRIWDTATNIIWGGSSVVRAAVL